MSCSCSLLITGGLVSVVVSRFSAPAGIDVIQTNELLPLLLAGNAVGWNAIGIGLLMLALWLAVHGLVRERR